MIKFLKGSFLLALILLGTQVPCQALADEIVYRGRVTIDGQAFDGTGYFKFALITPDGSVLWRNAEADAAGVPKRAVPLAVRKGVYEAKLGQTNLGMSPITEAVAEAFPNLLLRIWLEVGDGGFQQVFPDADFSEKGTVFIPEPDPVEKVNPIPVSTTTVAQQESNPAGMRIFALQDRQRYTLGDPNAPLVMLEYVDYECGHCKLFHEITFQKVKSEYIDTGKLFFISGNFPLQGHEHSQTATQAAYCAGDQGRYWQMRDLLFEHNQDLSTEKYIELATELGLHPADFYSCLESSKYAARAIADKEEARSLGIRQTPSFILGHRLEDGSLNGTLLEGAKMWTDFKKSVEAMMQTE